MIRTLSFYECEHEGDLEYYLADLTKSGAKIVSSEINYDAETAEVTIEVEDKDGFLEAYKKTETYGFSSLRD